MSRRHASPPSFPSTPPILSARLTGVEWLPLPFLARGRFRYRRRSLIWARFQPCGPIMLPSSPHPPTVSEANSKKGLFRPEDAIVVAMIIFGAR